MENNLEKAEFSSIKIGLASPEMILSWSYGEVKKPETINYRTLKAERDGLFCERIFGPTKDYECFCGKYKRIKHSSRKECEKCHVAITTKKVRRERMGHIKLAAPVAHIWYFRAIPSRMGLLLDISPRHLEKVLYFAQYIVIDPGSTPLEQNQLLSEKEYRDMYEKYENDFKVGMGAEAIKELLQKLDIEQMAKDLKEELLTASGQKKLRIIKRLDVIESFRKSGNKPEWMILDVLPVIPPEIRPMVQLDGGRFATSDLNDLYRRVINRNNRLAKLIELRAPEIIVKNEKRMLQEAVDALIDNGRRGKPVTGGSSGRPLKSLSEMLRGKQGRFRQNLLGKRVDYSGRSVIVVGPDLKIYQCGLPKEMALELFKPFVIKRLQETNNATNIKDAKKKVERASTEVWDALENVIKEHPVLLNRAPTLHRLSIQAFEPVLVEGRAIKLHPLVCSAFNADFDGDQMPVHVPLSAEAQAEARFLMLSANNLLKPVDGKAVAVPSQDMVLGSYYLTILKPTEIGAGSYYRDFNEAQMAYANGELGLHAPIKVRLEKEINGRYYNAIIETTLGRLIFNQPIPQDLGFVKRDPEDAKSMLAMEINVPAKKGVLSDIVDRTIKKHGATETAKVLDEIKANGYKYSTRSGISISVKDMTIPSEKKKFIAEAEAMVEEITENFQMGLLSEEERYKAVIKTWDETTKRVTDALVQTGLDEFNSLKMIIDSGARGSMSQMRQLAGMRGLMFATDGSTMEIPIKSNFREGLNVIEYFMGARSSRKSLSDTALKTADSGYLTRRLVDVAQDVIVTEEDCGTSEGVWIKDVTDGKDVIEPFADRLFGRYVIGDVCDKEGNVIVKDGEMITIPDVAKILDAGITELYVRSVLKCTCRHGVCSKCYGADMALTKPVSVGEAVGIIAAQSIGEPGTQLTMRTFHTGGVAGSDITQGLPRVEELFEARKPKRTSVAAEMAGTVRISDEKRQKEVTLTAEGNDNAQTFMVPVGTRILVEDGATVNPGDALTEGNMNPADILRIQGIDEVYNYIVREVQRVYRMQDIKINDKHIEIIARQMTRKIRIEDAGDTNLLVGALIERPEFEEANAQIDMRMANGETNLQKAVYSPVLLGITKASLMTESFLSAASFQETTKVLTEAAIKGKVDHLIGLKENVIIGKLIPAGTGLKAYRGVEVKDNNPKKYDLGGAYAYKNDVKSVQALTKDDFEEDEEIADEDLDLDFSEEEIFEEEAFVEPSEE